MTRVVIPSSYVELPDNHQLYTLAFTDDCDYETSATVLYDSHIYYASLWLLTPASL